MKKHAGLLETNIWMLSVTLRGAHVAAVPFVSIKWWLSGARCFCSKITKGRVTALVRRYMLNVQKRTRYK